MTDMESRTGILHPFTPFLKETGIETNEKTTQKILSGYD